MKYATDDRTMRVLRTLERNDCIDDLPEAAIIRLEAGYPPD